MRKVSLSVRQFALPCPRVGSIETWVTNYLDSDSEISPKDPVLRFSNLWSDFVAALAFTGEAFFQTYQRLPQSEVLKITCCDASEPLKLVYKEFHQVVAFSATLKPFEYYQDLLGLKEHTRTHEFVSPFPTSHRKLMIIPQISTKYQDRHGSAPRIAEVLNRVLRMRAGNYLALFPSFEFLQMTRRHLQIPGFEILQQEREMPPARIQAYLEALRQPSGSHLLLGVQGGVFSEGVDYAGDMLIGAFVVGPALPNFDFEREEIRAVFEKRYGKGKSFDYTYVHPAMARAVQSAGRVIRSESDRGMIILMDPRFLQESYSQSMPRDWFREHPHELVSQSILQDLQKFWASTDTEAWASTNTEACDEL